MFLTQYEEVRQLHIQLLKAKTIRMNTGGMEFEGGKQLNI